MTAHRREGRIGISLLLWGFLWRSVVWYTAAGALLGGMYGCAVVVSAFFTPGLDTDGWVWALRAMVALFGAGGFVGGWALARAAAKEIEPLLGALTGALIGVSLGGVYLAFYYLYAFPIGAILGGAYGLAVGLVNGVLTAIATCAFFSPLGEPPRHRRVIVVTSMLGVLVIPGYWSVGFVGSTDYEEFGELTGSFWGDALIYAGFPTLVLVVVSRWLGSRIAGWYERESARAIEGEVQPRPASNVEHVP